MRQTAASKSPRTQAEVEGPTLTPDDYFFFDSR